MTRLLVVIVASMALLAGCGGDSEVDEPADLVPADVPLYGEVVIRPSAGQREDIERLASRFLSGETLGSALEDLLDEGLAEESDAGPSPTYRQDVRPWLGERAGGFMTDLDPEEGAVLIETTDEDAAQRFIEKLAKADRTKESSKSHEGVEYLVDADGDAVGIVDGYLAIGTEAGLRAAIEAGDGDALADSDRFSDISEEAGAEDALAYGLVRPERIVEVVGSEDRENAELAEDFLSDLGLDFDAPYVATLGARDGAVTLDQRIALEQRSEGGDVEADLARLPEGSWLRLGSAQAGRSLGPAFVALLKLGAAQDNEEDQVPRILEIVEQNGIDLEDLGLADAAVFARGSDPATLDAGFVAEIENRDEADAAGRFLARGMLDDYESQPLPPLPGDPDGAVVDVDTLPKPLVVVVAEERFVVALGLEAARDALQDPAAGSLPPDLAAARQALGDVDLTGTLDVGRLLGLVESFQTIPDLGLSEARRILEPLGPLALGSARDGDALLLRLVARAE